MSDKSPSTPRPQLRLVSPPVEDAQGCRSELDLADTEPMLEELIGSDEARLRNPFGAACTLVWLAHSTLSDIGRGARAPRQEWLATRAVLESAVRYLVLGQAQRIVQPGGERYPRGMHSPLLEVLRRLCLLVAPKPEVSRHDSSRIWELGRRLDLAVQCVFDWTANRASVVPLEEVNALAHELQFVYRDLQALAAQKN